MLGHCVRSLWLSPEGDCTTQSFLLPCCFRDGEVSISTLPRASAMLRSVGEGPRLRGQIVAYQNLQNDD